MTRIVRRRFAADERSVPAARRFALGALENVGDDVRDVVALMVSELATNALLHAQTAFVVDVTLVADTDEIVVAVHDGAGGRPVVKDPEPTDAHGRGLRIVATLADRWGTGRSDQEPGTVVWFAVRRSGGSATTRRAGGGWADEQLAVRSSRLDRTKSARRRGGMASPISSIGWVEGSPARTEGTSGTCRWRTQLASTCRWRTQLASPGRWPACPMESGVRSAHCTGRFVRSILAAGCRGAPARPTDAGASTGRAASVSEGVVAVTGNLAP